MVLHCDYEALVKNLTDIAEVVEDKLSNEDLRNVIFVLGEADMKMVGINQLITFERKLSPEHFAYEGDKCKIQLKSKELLDFLNSYRTLRKTRIDEVTLESGQNGTIICKVLELDIDDNTPTVSTWSFTNIPIKPNIDAELTKERPEIESMEAVDTNSLLFYTRNLGVLLQAGTNLYSHLLFGEDYVVVFSTSHLSFMKNILGDVFKGVKLSYRAVGFMDKVICAEPTVNVAKLPTSQLLLETETSTAFIRFTDKLPDYNSYLELASKKDMAISLDRIYLKDILKRLRLLNNTVEFILGDDELTLKNTKFSQSMQIMRSKGMEDVEKRCFKIMPDVLERSILGNDDEFSGELFLYYCVQKANQVMLVLSDDSGTWFSALNIKPYSK